MDSRLLTHLVGFFILGTRMQHESDLALLCLQHILVLLPICKSHCHRQHLYKYRAGDLESPHSKHFCLPPTPLKILLAVVSKEGRPDSMINGSIKTFLILPTPRRLFPLKLDHDLSDRMNRSILISSYPSFLTNRYYPIKRMSPR